MLSTPDKKNNTSLPQKKKKNFGRNLTPDAFSDAILLFVQSVVKGYYCRLYHLTLIQQKNKYDAKDQQHLTLDLPAKNKLF